jgi:hypothetical protein
MPSRDIVTIRFNGDHYEIYSHIDDETMIMGKNGNDNVLDAINMAEMVLEQFDQMRCAEIQRKIQCESV